MGKNRMLSSKGTIVGMLSEHVNKKGRLKGKTKKETKILRGACVHHLYGKRDNEKPMIRPATKGYYVCRMCGSLLEPKIYSKDEVKKTTNRMREVVTNYQYMTVATHAGEASVRYSSELGSSLAVFVKNYGKVAKIAQKKTEVKKKKRADRRDSIGSWG